MNTLVDWLGRARGTVPFVAAGRLLEEGDALLADLPEESVARALVLDLRSRVLSHSAARAVTSEQRPCDGADAGGALERAGLWRLAATAYVQAAVTHLRGGWVPQSLDLVVRGVLASQVAARQAADGVEQVRLGDLDPRLAGVEAWASAAATEARLHNQLGIVAYELHAYDQAVLLYRSGLEAAASPAGADQQVFLLHNLAESLILRAALPDDDLGQQERQRLLTEALRAGRAVADGGHGSAWSGVDGPRLVADALVRLGRPVDAWEVLAGVEATHGRDPDEGQAPMLRLVRGRCLRALGRPVEATVELDAAVTRIERSVSPAEADLARLERSLAFEDAGDLEAAWLDAEAVARSTWGRHRDQVRGLFDLVWSRAGFEDERRDLEVLAETLTRVALADPLTGLLNRRGLEAALADLDPLATVGVLVVDVDYFKTVNDRYGHAVGDEVLCRLADTLTEHTGDAGVVARWGGEEFVVVLLPLPDAPGPAVDVAAGPVDPSRARRHASTRATAFAEGLRAAVAAIDHGDGGPRTTLSVGVAAGRARWWREVLQSADAAMFRAKRGGRDRVVEG